MGEDGSRSTSPCDCYLCLRPLTGEDRSEEHIIPNALGGRCSSYDLLCRDCNNSTGRGIDAELASQVLPVANLLGIKRERGEVPNVVVKRENGEELVRDSRGNMRPRRTSVASRLEGSTLRFEARGGPREVRQALRKLKKRYPTIDISDALDKIQAQISYTRESLEFSLDQLGGPTALRAVAKIAANFAVWRQHVVVPSCAPFVSGETQKNDVAWWWSGADPIVERPSDTVLNVVGLVGGEGRIRAYVELLHAFRFGVVVHEPYTGPSFTEVLARDVMTGSWIDVEWDPAKWKIDDLPPAEDFPGRMDAIVRVAQVAAHERSIREIVERAFARTLQERGPDATTEDLRPILWEEMESFVLAQIRASRATDSEPPDDELE